MLDRRAGVSPLGRHGTDQNRFAPHRCERQCAASVNVRHGEGCGERLVAKRRLGAGHIPPIQNALAGLAARHFRKRLLEVLVGIAMGYD